MARSLTVAAVDAWAKVTAPAVREGAEVDVSALDMAILHIDVALVEAAAEAIGASIFVQVSSNTTGDADWTNFATLGGPIGTPFHVHLASEEAAGQTVLSLTNPVTANMDTVGKLIFFLNTVDVTKSEIVFQVSQETDAGDTITILDGLTNTQEDTAEIWNIDTAGVSPVAQFNIQLPLCARVRVVYSTATATGTDIACRCRITKYVAQ